MYCPRCGQQQVSDEMRFCSRCGLLLTGLAQWVNSGALPAPSEKQVSPQSPRRKGMRRGAKVMFLSAVAFPVFLFFSILVDAGEPIFLPFVSFFVGLAILLYARLFSDPNAPATQQQFQMPGHNVPAATALPPASYMPAADIHGQRVRTKELAEPPSVTENTTRLLDNE